MTNMIQNAKDQAAALAMAAYKAAAADGTLPEAEVKTAPVEIPKDTANGDYTTTFALAAAKALGKPPRVIAQALLDHMDLTGTYFTSAEIAGPGFLNFRLGDQWYAGVMNAVETEKDVYGTNDSLKGQKIMVEFVSANPTGPMHMGNARGGVLGDTLASVLTACGADVSREFYVNDAGHQIDKFARSIEVRYLQLINGEDSIAFPEDGYQGEDIKELAKAYYDEHGDSLLNVSEQERQDALAQFGLSVNLPRMKTDLERYKIHYGSSGRIEGRGHRRRPHPRPDPGAVRHCCRGGGGHPDLQRWTAPYEGIRPAPHHGSIADSSGRQCGGTAQRPFDPRHGPSAGRHCRFLRRPSDRHVRRRGSLPVRKSGHCAGHGLRFQVLPPFLGRF